MKLKIKIKKLRPDVRLPEYALEGDAGMDIFSNEDVIIQPGERHTFATGFALEYPEGYVSLIWDKSGLSSKYGLKVMGGVLDHNYRGEYMVCLGNFSNQAYEFKKGDKIAQLLIQAIISAELEEVEELSESVRGENRHGSTGK
jgi:dUTP pyrophosphatase